MCFGGGDTPEQEQSQSEITAARNAVDKHNERHQDGYVQLEQKAISDAGIDHTGQLKGIASADLAAQEAQAYSLASPDRQRTGFRSYWYCYGYVVR